MSTAIAGTATDTRTGSTAQNTAEANTTTVDKEIVRLSLHVSPELNELLERLAATIRGTKSDVLRKAIVLMNVAVEARKSRKKLALVDEDQPVATEIVGLF